MMLSHFVYCNFYFFEISLHMLKNIMPSFAFKFLNYITYHLIYFAAITALTRKSNTKHFYLTMSVCYGLEDIAMQSSPHYDVQKAEKRTISKGPGQHSSDLFSHASYISSSILSSELSMHLCIDVLINSEPQYPFFLDKSSDINKVGFINL